MPRITAEPNKWRTWAILSHFVPTVHRSFSIFICGTLGQGNHLIIMTPSFRKASFLECFLSKKRRKVDVVKFLRFQKRSKKLRFRDGLVWTVGLAGETKLGFKFLHEVWCLPKFPSGRT